jgi:mRNA interferase YafQ
MYNAKTSNRFKRDYKLAKKQGKDLDKLATIMRILADGDTLSPQYREHRLTGNWKNRKECHIEPDWLLIYKIDNDNNAIIFERTGSHSELFR